MSSGELDVQRAYRCSKGVLVIVNRTKMCEIISSLRSMHKWKQLTCKMKAPTHGGINSIGTAPNIKTTLTHLFKWWWWCYHSVSLAIIPSQLYSDYGGQLLIWTMQVWSCSRQSHFDVGEMLELCVLRDAKDPLVVKILRAFHYSMPHIASWFWHIKPSMIIHLQS